MLKRSRSRSPRRGAGSDGAEAAGTGPRRKSRASRMDMIDQSDLKTSGMVGWFNLFFIAAGFHVVAENVRSFMENGTVAAWDEFVHMFAVNWPNWPVVWLTIVVFGIVPPLLLAVANADKLVSRYATVWCLALYSCAYLLATWIYVWNAVATPATQLMFFLAQSAIMWMKFHSYVMVNADLKQPKPGLTDFLYFCVAPVLVYEPDFPRTPSVRPAYLAEKILLTVVVFASLHNLVSSSITPILAQVGELSIVAFVSQMLVPMILFYIMLFFFVFECVLNCVAELLRFGERDFYEDWWNSTTFSEFARKWNTPTHKWLSRHIYEDAQSHRIGKTKALALTFLFSAIVHECILMMLVRSLRPYLLPMQMSQVLLIMFGRRLKGTKLGNLVFHLGIGIGVPLLTCLYARENVLNRPALAAALGAVE